MNLKQNNIMKYKLRIKNYKLRVKLLLLSAFCFLPSALTAQIEIKELKLTPEIEEMVVTKIKNLPEKDYAEWGIKNRSQLENLQLGKSIPQYFLVSDKLPFRHAGHASLDDGEPLSLEFTNDWTVPVMSGNEPLLFCIIHNNFGKPYIDNGIKNTIERFNNYEYKDSIIGSIFVTPSGQMDHLIIRKENQDIFVQIYDEVTGAYFKNEYRLNELIPHIKELDLREREAKMKYYERYYAQVADKSELILTPEITEMEVTRIQNLPDVLLSDYGVTNRSQLDHIHLGKPIPMYEIINEKLTFIGQWFVLVMLDGEPLRRSILKLEDNGQYEWIGSGSRGRSIHNYEHKELIIGILGTTSFHGVDYVIIRKENQDIFVQWYDRATREYFKNEYTLSEIMNMLKK